MSKAQSVELVDVTPEIAHDWLGHNTHNRRLRWRTVDAYASDMAGGDWQWNGESVKFATDGTLLDGQHRLAAVVKAAVTVPMLVVRGLQMETQDTVDGGVKRSFSDVLHLRGEINWVTLSAVVRRVALWEIGARFNSNVAPTTAYLLQTLEKYPHLRNIAQEAAKVSRGCALRPGTIGLCVWLFDQIDSSDCDFFFARLHDGQNMAKGDPIYELRRTAEGLRTARGARSESYMTAITIKAWNAYRDGSKVALLRFKPGGASPEKFPEPR